MTHLANVTHMTHYDWQSERRLRSKLPTPTAPPTNQTSNPPTHLQVDGFCLQLLGLSRHLRVHHQVLLRLCLRPLCCR
jgi:hypothetical protein